MPTYYPCRKHTSPEKGVSWRGKRTTKNFFLFFFALDILICSLLRSKNHDFFGGNYFAKMYYLDVKSAFGVVLSQRKILYVVSESLVSNRPTSNCWYLWLWSKVSKKNSMPFGNWNFCCTRHHPLITFLAKDICIEDWRERTFSKILWWHYKDYFRVTEWEKLDDVTNKVRKSRILVLSQW